MIFICGLIVWPGNAAEFRDRNLFNAHRFPNLTMVCENRPCQLRDVYFNLPTSCALGDLEGK